MEGNALEVSDEQPKSEIFQSPNGVWIGKIEEVNINLFVVKNRGRETEDSVRWVDVGTITRITQVEYETYKEFNLFGED